VTDDRDIEVPEKSAGQSGEPDGPTPETTHNNASEVAPGAGKPKPTPADRIARLAGSKGGKVPRAVALIGVNGVPATLDLRSSDNRMAVIEAVLGAVVRGQTSALAATTALSAIKEARSEANDQWERLAHAQAKAIESLRNGGREIDSDGA
jgi:hypothetical protein